MKQYYYYDQEECRFVPVDYRSSERIIYTGSSWILCGVVLSAVAITTLSFVAGSPAEISLKAENQELYEQLDQTQGTLKELDEQIADLSETDNELYRAMLGADPISEDERQVGVGGADMYSDFDVYQDDTAELLRRTSEELDNLERRVAIQQSSFEDVKRMYNENREAMQYKPIIKPVGGRVTSTYGMRPDPLLGYERHHQGVDFRARVGTPIYATGNGVIRFAGRRGHYGRVVEIDHGNGYVTRYAHLSELADGIQNGAQVTRGQEIARSGETGRTLGPHLHYEIHHENRPINPMDYLVADVSPEEYREYRRITDAAN